MKLGLQSVLDTPGAKLPFSFTLDLSQMEMGYQKPAAKPVLVEGTVENRAGVVYFDADVKAELSLNCDRCATEFTQYKELPVSCVLAATKQSEENEEIVRLAGDTLDVTEIVVPAFVLDMGLQTLCDEACKGLCPQCGRNLNQGDCGCSRQDTDPRWDALKHLLAPDTEGEDSF